MVKMIKGLIFLISAPIFFWNQLTDKRRKNLAFTLLELIVCVALVAIIFMIINKFTSTTSRQSRIFTAKQQSDTNFLLYKGQIISDLSQDRLKPTPPDPNTPYTFQIGDKIQYSHGCASADKSSSNFAKYVSVLKGSTSSNRLSAVENQLTHTINTWISSAETDPAISPTPCDTNEVSRIEQYDISVTPPKLISSYPSTNTPVAHVNDGGVIASLFYVKNSTDNNYTYIHLFKASIPVKANDNSEDVNLIDAHGNNLVQVIHDYIEINNKTGVTTAVPVVSSGPSMPSGDDDDDDDPPPPYEPPTCDYVDFDINDGGKTTYRVCNDNFTDAKIPINGEVLERCDGGEPMAGATIYIIVNEGEENIPVVLNSNGRFHEFYYFKKTGEHRFIVRYPGDQEHPARERRLTVNVSSVPCP